MGKQIALVVWVAACIVMANTWLAVSLVVADENVVAAQVMGVVFGLLGIGLATRLKPWSSVESKR